MITAGVDCGAKNTKVVILKDGRIIGKGMILTGFNQKEAAEKAFNDAIGAAKLERSAIVKIVLTGTGRKGVDFGNGDITDVGAAAKGALFYFPTAKTVIDVGAEEGRGIRCNEKGKVIDFAVNEKCAAGAGAFTEAMARALEVKLEEIGELSLKSQKAVPMNAQCAVFAESEVVSLIHAKTPKEDIARAVHDAIASRISSMVRRIGIEKDVALVGGVARNIGFVHSLRSDLEVDLLIPEDPEYAAALGAALSAGENI
ncbi:MAG: acyl-CoA dehydratase activase [Acidobacteriota bacterium]